jgi:uncharacterized membrane protein
MDPQDLTIMLLVVIGAVVLLPILGMSIWGFGMMDPWAMGYGMMGWRPSWVGGLGALAMLLLIAGVMLVVLTLTRRAYRGQTPLELLKYRLAKGEITKQQYEELKEVL